MLSLAARASIWRSMAWVRVEGYAADGSDYLECVREVGGDVFVARRDVSNFVRSSRSPSLASCGEKTCRDSGVKKMERKPVTTIFTFLAICFQLVSDWRAVPVCYKWDWRLVQGGYTFHEFGAA